MDIFCGGSNLGISVSILLGEMAKFYTILLFSLTLCSYVDGAPYVTVKQGTLFGETVDFYENGASTTIDVFKVRKIQEAWK